MNITQYVKKYQATFDEAPLTDVDSLVLCELSYLQFDRSVSGKPTHTLAELAGNIDALVTDTLLPKSNVKLLKAIAESRRYGEVKVGYFRQRNDTARETRFAAMTFELPTGVHYVAFRGTDITLLGWKEDFNMAIVKVIPSQKLASEYLGYVASRTEGELVLGGHSKGGNLVVYAGVFAEEQVQSRITAIYDHDGPGFRQSIFSDERYVAMSERIHKTVPHDSIIGMLLHVTDKYEVVESNSVSVMQHNPFSWEIDPDTHLFRTLPATARTSVAMDETLTAWINGLDEPTTKKLVTALFAVIEGSGAATVPELLKRPITRLRGMTKAYKALDEESRQLLSGNGKQLLSLWFASMRHVLSAK